MDSLLGIHRLASRLRLPREWLRQEALAGRLPCLRVGRRLLFNPAAVERALAERAAQPPANGGSGSSTSQAVVPPATPPPEYPVAGNSDDD